MLLNTLSQLRCPSHRGEAALCLGELSVLKAKKKKSNDLIFGSLLCNECQATYPVLAGVAVLVNDVEHYLQWHAKGVSALVKDSEIPSEYRQSFLLAKSEIQTGTIEEDLESQRINSLYYMNHFLTVAKSRKNPWWRPRKGAFSPEIDRLVRMFWDSGPFFQVAKWAKPLKNQKVIEIGCGVGGLARILSPSAESYLGIDSSLASIALARHIYHKTPYPLSVNIPQDLFHGPLTGKKDFPHPKLSCRNLDFVVGDLQDLPVAPGHFDLSVALNAIDMIENPWQLPRLQFDLLKEGGIAIQSCPYIWQNAVSENLRKSLPKSITSSSEAVEYLYEKTGFKIFKKIEHLPWLFLKHFRQIEMYSVHLFAAKKAAA